MSTVNTPAELKQSAKPASSAIPVRLVRFARPVDIRPLGMTEKAVTGRQGNAEYTVTYEPAIRHIKVVVSSPESTGKVLIPESSVLCWYPAD